MLVLVDLIVSTGHEVFVGKRMFGAYGISVVDEVGTHGVARDVMLGEAEGGAYVEKFNHLVGYLKVEIEEKLILFLVKGTYVVLIVWKERALSVG